MTQHDHDHDPVGIGIVGTGVISDIYLANTTRRFDNLRVVGVADLLPERAAAAAAKHGVAALTVDALLAHPEVEIVVNLTIPLAHAEVALRAIAAGKSVYNEKPLAATRGDAAEIVAQAEAAGVQVGSAPDTFLGAGMQTARAVLDAGTIGTPVAASAALLLSGHERWHPNPDFYYLPGGGPLFDMGPYYLAALVSLLGPVERVSGVATTSFPTRIIASGPRAGESVPVSTPTHIVATLLFASGVAASLTTSFDVHDTAPTSLLLYGSEGTLRLPDPNTFGGPLEMLRAGETAWEPLPLAPGPADNSRGLGVSDLARALRTGTPARTSGALGLHIVDIMTAVLESAERGEHVTLGTTMIRPDAMPTGT